MSDVKLVGHNWVMGAIPWQVLFYTKVGRDGVPYRVTDEMRTICRDIIEKHEPRLILLATPDIVYGVTPTKEPLTYRVTYHRHFQDIVKDLELPINHLAVAAAYNMKHRLMPSELREDVSDAMKDWVDYKMCIRPCDYDVSPPMISSEPFGGYDKDE